MDLPEVDGDTVPPHPGEAGLATLLGIDADGDGVRDDVEIWVNEQPNLDTIKRKTLKDFARLLQQNIVTYNNKEAAIESKYKEIGYYYCLKARFPAGSASGDDISDELRVQFYNTRDRLLTWSRGEMALIV